MTIKQKQFFLWLNLFAIGFVWGQDHHSDAWRGFGTLMLIIISVVFLFQLSSDLKENVRTRARIKARNQQGECHHGEQGKGQAVEDGPAS